ncbi:MAG: DUF3102 domain-containing protein [Xenococcaceae cyanobacterium]
MAQLSELKKSALLTSFDYKILSRQKQTIVQNCTGEIKERLRRTARDIWEIGQKLVEVRSQLEHGQFEVWLSAEFGWSRRTAYNFINVYEAFSDSKNFARLDIATSALYKLAAPSTPQSIRNEFLNKAEKGEKLTHKEISQALATAKRVNVVEKPQPISPPLRKILQIRPKAKTELEAPEVEKTAISRFQSSFKQVMSATQIEIKSGCWYLFEKINFLFCGDTALAEFCHRAPEATLALAVTSDDWDHDWLIDKVSNLILLKEASFQIGMLEQIISMLSAKGDTVIFPWLPDEDMLAIAHRLHRRIVAGDPRTPIQ